MQDELTEIIHRIENTGQCPLLADAAEVMPDGRLDTIFNYVNDDEWFAFTSWHIWFVRANDGFPNIWMGGQSGRGHCIDYDGELADRIRSLLAERRS